MKKVKRSMVALVLMSAVILGCSDESSTSPSEETSVVSKKCPDGNDHSWALSGLPTKPTSREEGVKKEYCVRCQEQKVTTTPKLEIPSTAEKLSEIGKLRLLRDEELESFGITATSKPPKIEGAEYYVFGFYPQTYNSSVKLDEKMLNTEVDDNINYYLGDDDKWYSGDKYKVEPLVWRKLAGSNILVSERAIGDRVDYSNDPYNKHPLRKIDDKEIYKTNYEYSRVRAYLNGLSYQSHKYSEGEYVQKSVDEYLNKGILQRSFTKDQIANQIADTLVDNSVESASLKDGTPIPSEYICNDTIDKLFLLSVKDIETPSYGFNSSTLKRFEVISKYECNWWLRSPIDVDKVRYVKDGTIGEYDHSNSNYVVPALTLK